MVALRIKSWADRFKIAMSFGGQRTTIPASDPVALPSERIPVSVNKFFHGRESDLDYLHGQLHSGLERPTTVCISGLPGMGKTQLAARYCKYFGSKYFACIWVSSDNHTKIGNTLSECAVNLKLEGSSIKEEPRKNAQLLVSWLQTTSMGRCPKLCKTLY